MKITEIGIPHQTVDTADILKTFIQMMDVNANVNFYMFHGNFNEFIKLIKFVLSFITGICCCCFIRVTFVIIVEIL